MRNKLSRILYILSICVIIVFAASCTKQGAIASAPSPADVSVSEPATNGHIVNSHITSFLTNGYSKYYRIISFEHKIWKETESEGQYEAMVLTTMKTSNNYKDPNTVPYIIEAREKALKETDTEKKLKLQKEYATLVKQYNDPQDTNFFFKATAGMKEGKIDEDSIQLFVEQEGPTGVMYIPAEEILPKK
jgi:hypothetical protein